MLKTIIIGLALLVSALPSFAGGIMMMGGGVADTTADSCTSGLLFSWHAEDVDVTLGSPTGCSAGDTTATAVSGAVISATQKSDGSYAVSVPTAGDYYQFDATDIVSTSLGTVTFDVYITTWAANNGLFRVYTDSNNYIRVLLTGTSDVAFRYSGGGSGVVVTTSGINLTTGSWHSIKLNWRTGATNPSLSVQVDEGTAQTVDTDLASYSGSPTYVQFGEIYNNSNGGMYLDNIKIYNDWR